jgi:cell shape-determining protein MreD
MRNIVAFPLLGLAVILQSAVISHVKLLSGYADLPLVMLTAWALQKHVKSAWHWVALACVMLGFVSSMPWIVQVLGFSGVVFISQSLQRRVWQAPLLAMFSATFAGTLLMHSVSFTVLRVLGTPFSLGDVVSLITLPSLLLNMLLAIPVYPFIRDLARWVYSTEEYE